MVGEWDFDSRKLSTRWSSMTSAAHLDQLNPYYVHKKLGVTWLGRQLVTAFARDSFGPSALLCSAAATPSLPPCLVILPPPLSTTPPLLAILTHIMLPANRARQLRHPVERLALLQSKAKQSSASASTRAASRSVSLLHSRQSSPAPLSSGAIEPSPT